MDIGERFHFKGYTPMAYLQHAVTGEVIVVMHNCSSHILVAKTDAAAIEMVDEETHAVLIASFDYQRVPEHRLSEVYARALAEAVAQVLRCQ